MMSFFCTVWNIFYLLVTPKIYGFRSPSWMLTTILHFPLNISTHEVLQALQVQHLKLWSLFSLCTLLLLQDPYLIKKYYHSPNWETQKHGSQYWCFTLAYTALTFTSSHQILWLLFQILLALQFMAGAYVVMFFPHGLCSLLHCIQTNSKLFLLS